MTPFQHPAFRLGVVLTACATSLGLGVSPAVADAHSAYTGPLLTAGGNTYDGAAAAQWAADHSNDVQPFDAACTWFASHALWAGDLPQDANWNTDGTYGRDLDFGVFELNHQRSGTQSANAVIELLDYLTTTYPATYIEPLSMAQNDVPDARPGDLVLYVWGGDPDWATDGNTDIHLAVVTGSSPDNPQYPVVAEWGDQSRGSAHAYPGGSRGWTWSQVHNRYLQVDHPNMDAYLVHIDTGIPSTY